MNAVACTVPIEWTPAWKIRAWTQVRKPMQKGTFYKAMMRLLRLGVIEASHRSHGEYRFNRHFKGHATTAQ